MKIALLHNQIVEGVSKDELDNQIQCEVISRSLSEMGHESISMPYCPNLRATAHHLKKMAPDVVFNLVESVNGKGRFIYMAPLMLDCLHIPYTGSKTAPLTLTTNKLFAKWILKASGIATPQWISSKKSNHDLKNGGAYIIKSVWEHASIGLSQNSVVYPDGAEYLSQQLKHFSIETAGPCFAESYIDGREYSISILENENGLQVLPPAEILFRDYPDRKFRIVDYAAKWEEDSFEYRHTYRNFDFSYTDTPLLHKLASISIRCWHLFHLRGFARIDFRVDQNQKPWVLEINANPCLSPDGGFMAAAAKGGLSDLQVIQRILNAALRTTCTCRALKGIGVHDGSNALLAYL